jgi:hypothetical protein
MAMENRLFWFKFEDRLVVNSNGILLDSNYPTSIDYNAELAELYVGTRCDIRCIDLHTGRINRILANIVDAESEIGNI